MKNCIRRRHTAFPRWLCCLFAVAMQTAGGCNSDRSPPSRSTRNVQLEEAVLERNPPPLRPSPYLNTAAGVSYVGSQVCGDCHEAELQSHRNTTHSRALAEVDIDFEPADGEVTHELSGRSYQVYRQANQLWHREFVRERDGRKLVLAEYPMKFVIGSGNNSRSYLVEIGGFLFESPVTWYASTGTWGMSPGYENNPVQPGFSRPIEYACVNCHSGHVEKVGGSNLRLQVREMSIGCERCHGPGALHVASRRAGETIQETEDAPDYSIVNPRHLPRETREAICAQCHLSSATHIDVSGRSIADYRPGLHLSDFRVDYQLDDPETAMTVVGHVEQMRLSRCYQQSSTLSCTSCHNPHEQPVPERQVEYYRSRCLSCHAVDSCGVAPSESTRVDAGDDCVMCHMPQAPTDIAHFAFTHHRIGIHDEQPPIPTTTHTKVADLVPLDDLSHLPEVEQQRCLALAYMRLAEDSAPHVARAYDNRARKILDGLFQKRIQAPDLDAAVAWLYRQQGDHRRCIERAESALAAKTIRPPARQDALMAASRSYFDSQQFERAIPLLEQLSDMRFDAEDQFLLSLSRHRTRDIEGALSAAERAAQLEPDRPDLQELLSMLHAEAGDMKLSAAHADRAERLRASLRSVVGSH